MEKQMIVVIETAFLLACILFATCAVSEIQSFLENNANPIDSFQHSISAYAPHTIFGATAMHSPKHPNFKQATINRSSKNNGKITIFQGRGAVNNLAIFYVLVAEGPLNMGDIQRRLNRIRGLEVTYIASLYKRIHALVQGGYIGEVKPAVDQAAGFRVCRYEVCTKFYLAYYLNGKSRDEILRILKEPNATNILSELINAEITEA